MEKIKIFRFALSVMVLFVAGILLVSCGSQKKSSTESYADAAHTTGIVTGGGYKTDDNENTMATGNPTATAEAMPTEKLPETELILPTPDTSATKDEINTEIAESFFNGKWESSSGMFYIFDGVAGTVILQKKDTGEVLLEGTYETFSEDFNEFCISMTFHGETDSFIAWKYDDTEMVNLIIEETGRSYDTIWRVDS